MTTTNNMNANFNFRTKFKKVLNDENYSAITSAFQKFCNFTTCEARKTLWNLTYSSTKALEVLSYLGLSSEIISYDNQMIFRNELRFQYEQLCPSFMLPSMEDLIKSKFSALESKTDIIVANIVFDYCHAAMIKDEQIDRILFLLKSEKDTNYFGGIRSLGFNMEEAQYLKPFHIEIHNLLASMKDFFENDVPFYMEEEEEKVEAVEQISEEESTELPEKKSDETSSKFKSITPEALLIHREIFASYVYGNDMNILMEIGHLGFDLNEVIAKAEKIQSFLNAAENLS